VSTPHVRQVYVRTCEASLELLGHYGVARMWDGESRLPGFSVAGLAGHLGRSTLQVEMFLDAPEPTDEPISAVEYYAQLVGVRDPESELNTGVRARGEEVAATGHAGLVDAVAESLKRLRKRLPAEPDIRQLSAFGRTLRLDEYLRTRLVELTVHIDDLALSTEVEPPAVPTEAYTTAIDVLVAVGRRNHGDLGVLRALTRRERDDVDALHVL
jgi:hypothetical protein